MCTKGLAVLHPCTMAALQVLTVPLPGAPPQMLKAAMDGGDGSSIPGADASSLAATASQFIDDMEEQEMVPDRR
jgi:hypothetical protein